MEQAESAKTQADRQSSKRTNKNSQRLLNLLKIMSNDLELKKQIEVNLQSFLSGDLRRNALQFFETLGYESDKIIELQPNTPEGFKTFLSENSKKLTNEKKAYLDEWETVDFLFQLTDEEINRTKSLFDSNSVDVTDKRIESYLFFAIKLDIFPK